MAVLIASDLAKDMAGEPLLRGVSLKLERRDRLTIAGRNGAGKTTLLRMLAGETSIDGGELVLAKGTRVALHDQRPPRDRDLSLRDYVAVRLPRAAGARGRAGPPGAGDGDRRPAGARPLQRRLRRASRRPAATAGASARRSVRARPRLPRRRPRPPAAHLLRRPAHACVAGARARRPARPAAARRADQPPRHRVARVARADAAVARRGDRHGRPRSLVPGGGRHRRARARGGPRALLQGHLGAVAPRAGGARAGARPGDREAAGRDRAHGALRRALPLQGDARRARRSRASRRWTRWSGSERDPRDGRSLGFDFKAPERSGRVIFELEDGRLEVPGRVLWTAASCGSSAASTSRWSAPTARARRR